MSTHAFQILGAVAAIIALSACGQPGGAGDEAPDEPGAEEAVAETATRETPLWETHPGASDFEAWPARGGASVLDAAATAPDGSMTAGRLMLGADGVIGLSYSDMPVEPGDRFIGRIWLKSEQGGRVNLQIVRWCSQTPGEVGAHAVSPTAEWTMYEVPHTFEHAHECVRFQISGLQENSDVYAWNASVERG